MNAILQPLFALLAVLSVATGTAQNKSNLQPRVPIFAPESIQSSHDITSTGSVEITGTIQSVTSTLGVSGTTTIVLTSGITVTVDGKTETKGNLKPGMPVSIEGTLQPDGSILASEIKPGLGKGDDKGKGEDKGKGDDHRNVITATLTITDVDRIDDDRVITGTVTGDKDTGDHKVITGTMGVGDKHTIQTGDDQNIFPGNGLKPKSPSGSQFNSGNANTNQPNGTGNNGGSSQNHSDGNQNSPGSQNKGDHSGGGGSGRH